MPKKRFHSVVGMPEIVKNLIINRKKQLKSFPVLIEIFNERL